MHLVRGKALGHSGVTIQPRHRENATSLIDSMATMLVACLPKKGATDLSQLSRASLCAMTALKTSTART